MILPVEFPMWYSCVCPPIYLDASQGYVIFIYKLLLVLLLYSYE